MSPEARIGIVISLTVLALAFLVGVLVGYLLTIATG
jgi:hypothetical protein